MRLAYDRLRELAYSSGPSAKLPTNQQLCELLQFSRTTIDSALTALEAENVIYRRRGSGIYVSPRIRQKTVAVLLPSAFYGRPNASPFWNIVLNLLLASAGKRSRSRDEQYIFQMVQQPGASKEDDLQEVEALCSSGQLNAVIGIGLSEHVMGCFASRGIPVIGFAGAAEWFVSIEDTEVFRLGWPYLEGRCRYVECWQARPTEEHKAPLGLKNPADDFAHPDHLYYALARNGLNIPYERLRIGVQKPEGAEGPMDEQEQGYELAMRVFGSDGPRPDGLVIGNDLMTSGVLVAFRKLGIRLGEDVRIVSHYNQGSRILFGYESELSLAVIDPAEVVDSLFDYLGVLLSGDKPTRDFKYVHHRLVGMQVDR